MTVRLRHRSRTASGRPEGFVIWLTGLPSAGKTTLGTRLEPLLAAQGLKVARLDGDDVRRGLSKDLGFSRSDREENVRRVTCVARSISRAGGVAVVSVIAPFAKQRRECRRKLRRFVEVYVECPLKVCMARDVKGLYRRAKRGEIHQVTGIDAPYDPPVRPEITVHTATQSVQACLLEIMKGLEGLGYLPKGLVPPGPKPRRKSCRS